MPKLQASFRILFVLVILVSPALAATLPITTLNDTDVVDGQCSLREAIVAANGDAAYKDCPAGSGEDHIAFEVEGTVVLQADLPTVTRSVVVTGTAGGATTIDGDRARRIFTLDSPGNNKTLTLRRLTLLRGYSASEGGCLRSRRGDSLVLEDTVVRACFSSASGGGIYALEPTAVTLRRCTLSRNEGNGGAGMAVVGDLAAPAVVTIEESTISDNHVYVLFGAPVCCGGLFLHGAVAEIRRSTISGNTARDTGGGLGVVASEVTLDGVTVTGNVGDIYAHDDPSDGGGVVVVGEPGFTAVLRIRNSIIADNHGYDSVPSDLELITDYEFHTEGFNLIGTNADATGDLPDGQPNVHGDWVGTSSAPLAPGLGPLQYNGGATFTHLPQAGSLPIDRGSCPGDGWDQRGYGDPVTLLRAVDDPAVPNAFDGCDIGAVERGASLVAPSFADGFESGDTSAWSATVP